MMKINKKQLRELISQEISSEALNSGYDYSGIENMSWLCAGLSKIETIPFLDTRNVQDMWGMFFDCKNLREIDPGNFPLYDFSELDNKFLRGVFPMKVIDVCELRKLISQGISTEDLNSRYDYSRVRDMSYLCHNMKEIKNIPFLNTQNIRNLRGMFWGCWNLQEIPLLDTGNVEDMWGMFWGCLNLREIPLLDTRKVEIMSVMFRDCNSLRKIPPFDTRNVRDMMGMFFDCGNLREIDPGNFPLYDFSELDNKFLREKFPEYFI